jgi:hypothetical protein
MDYARAAATSLRLLTSFGKSVTLRMLSGGGVYDPETSTVSAPAEVEESRVAVFLDFDRIQSGIQLRNGTLLQAGDRRVLLDPVGAAPTLSALIVDGATLYKIVDIKEVSPAGTPVLYDLVCRR